MVHPNNRSTNYPPAIQYYCNTYYNIIIIITAVCITDKASIISGGSTDPLALGCLYSLGAINMANNRKIQSGVTDVLEKYDVMEKRIYINFFDMPRDCVGWNRATFAG